MSVATLNGLVRSRSFPVEVHFEWGTSLFYGNVTPTQSIPAGEASVPFSANLTGLLESTTYHFRSVASYSRGIIVSPDQTFITPNCGGPPVDEWTIEGADECLLPGIVCDGIHFSVAPTNGCILETCQNLTPVVVSVFEVDAFKTFGPFATNKTVAITGSVSGTIPNAICGPSSSQSVFLSAAAVGLAGYSGDFHYAFSGHDGGPVVGSFNITGILLAGNTFTVFVASNIGMENATIPTPVISGTVNIT